MDRVETNETKPAASRRTPGARRGFAALSLGAVGVVFGDIGTSPLYALREALAHSRPMGPPHVAVLGVVSLILWTLTIIVTVKYVLVLMRASNNGEGGAVALMSLAQRAIARPSGLLFLSGILGVALFYGDGIITPAFSVLAAVEGLKGAPHLGRPLAPFVLPVAAGILVSLFLVQRRGTHRVGALFGPVMTVWFLTLGALGVWRLAHDLSVLRAISPYWAVRFLVQNGVVGFIILGAVFLAVTGAEALYADMGQFGRRPIRAAWGVLVFPCLALNYLGQGALVLEHPGARFNPFFDLAPHWAYWPVLVLATIAAVIASQAVITGAFSMTRQAVQVGLLPRIEIRRTSETQSGQIFVPAVNGMMLIGVLVLLVVFQNSHRFASAYGVAVTGTMMISTLLTYVVARRLWRWNWLQVAGLLIPISFIDLVFFSSNLSKIAEGAWLPLAFGAALVVVMWTWSRGVRILMEKTRADSPPIADLIEMLARRPPHRAPGTAMFLTANPDLAPVALMHNLKHNKVLHERNVLLTIETAETPHVADDARIRIETLAPDFKRVTLRYGFMESPNVPKTLAQCRRQGLKFDIMSTSFFLGRRKVVPDARSHMPLWQDNLFIFLMKNAANPTDFFRIPPGRVVELGAQLTI
ncbi:MAG TPA: potassium transporter Kup [Caulobacteraceae bacterium]|jgi:KUP system potassium uptake protein|nr:potassium transporter Kup [Caulobacteraceae bacterium]